MELERTVRFTNHELIDLFIENTRLKLKRRKNEKKNDVNLYAINELLYLYVCLLFNFSNARIVDGEIERK